MLHTYEEYKMLIEKRAVGIDDYVKQIINFLVDAGAPRELVSDDKTKQCIREQFETESNTRDKSMDGWECAKHIKDVQSDRLAKDFTFALWGRSSFYLMNIPILMKRWGVRALHFYNLGGNSSKEKPMLFKDVIDMYKNATNNGLPSNFSSDMLDKYGDKELRVSVVYEKDWSSLYVFDNCVLYYNGSWEGRDYYFMTADEVKKDPTLENDKFLIFYTNSLRDKMSNFIKLFHSMQSGVDKLQAKQDRKDNGE